MWDYFKGLQVKNQDVTQFNGIHEVNDFGDPMYYYRFKQNQGCKASTTTALLVDIVDPVIAGAKVQCGQCGAFTRLFLAVLSTQGVRVPTNPGGTPVPINDATTSSPLPFVLIEPKPISGVPQKLYVKEYTGTVLQSNPIGDFEYIQNPTLGDQLDGQNESNPKESAFDNHQFARLVVGGEVRWFDLSYGKEYLGADPFAKKNYFEATALAGTGYVSGGDTIMYLDNPDTNSTASIIQSYHEEPPPGQPD